MRVIRAATSMDIPAIMKVLDEAKQIMRSSGNPQQWDEGYPSEAMIMKDVERGGGTIIEDGGRIVAYFAFLPSPEPTYSVIEGQWLDDTLPYHVIHRIGSIPDAHGVFSDIISWCLARDRNLRIDTHRDNRIMQHCIQKAGFEYCGIIHLASGDERLAYQKCGD